MSCIQYMQEMLRCNDECESWPDCVLRPQQNFPEFCYYKKRKRKQEKKQ